MPSLTLRDGLETCTEYEVKFVAVIGKEYSEAREKRFAEMLEASIVTSLNGVFARWNTFKELSCVQKYIIPICKEGNGCADKGQIELDNSLQYWEYFSTVTLEQCSNYSLHIKPIFPRESSIFPNTLSSIEKCDKPSKCN
jgi:hypothetical protein